MRVLFFFVSDLCTPFREGIAQRGVFCLLRIRMFISLNGVFLVNGASGQSKDRLSIVLISLRGNRRQVLLYRFFRTLNYLYFELIFASLDRREVYIINYFNDDVINGCFFHYFSDHDVQACDDDVIQFRSYDRRVVNNGRLLMSFQRIMYFPRFRINAALWWFARAFQFFRAQGFGRSATNDFRALSIQERRTRAISANARCIG